MNGLLQDLRYALRQLSRDRGFTTVAVLTLALGIAANTAIFTVVNSVLLRPLPYKDSQRIVRIWNTFPPRGLNELPVSEPEFLEFRQSRSFDHIGAFVTGAVNLSRAGHPERVNETWASADVFLATGAETILGRAFSPEEDQRGRNQVVVLVVLAGAGLMIKSMARLLGVALGFNPKNVLTMSMTLPQEDLYNGPPGVPRFCQELNERVTTIPGVVAVGAVAHLPLNGGAGRGFVVEGRPDPGAGDRPGADYSVACPNHFRAMGVRIIKGREFTDQDTVESPGVIVIDEAMAHKSWPGEDPSGRVIDLGGPGGPRLTVVGVVADMRHRQLDEEMHPQFFRPYPLAASPWMSIVVRAHIAVSPAALSNPAKGRAAWQELIENMRRVPGVRSVALTDIVPMRVGDNVVGHSRTASIPSLNQLLEALASAVTPEYLNVMRLPLLRGRFFGEDDRLGTSQGVVIDEHLARHAFGEQDPVGKPLWIPSMGDKPVQVVGVVGHVLNWGLAEDDLSSVQDQVYYPLAQVPDKLARLLSSVISIVIRTEVPPLNAVEALKRQARGATGDQSLYEIRTMEQLASASLAQQRFLLLLFALFSGLALLLACVGIYSVIAHLTRERVPEFGVRMALGASSADIVRLVLRESLSIIFAGVGIGIVISVATERVLQRLVPGAQAPLNSTFALVVPVLIALGLLASYVPARRAPKVDPMVALRYQ